MNNMTSLVSLGYNNMDDNVHNRNQSQFRLSLNDPNLGLHSDSLFGKKDSLVRANSINQSNQLLQAGSPSENMRMTRKRSSKVNYKEFPKAAQGLSTSRQPSVNNVN